ncbi:hypothetical protein THRCLA_20433 [Thraustotheca clavata]|uniref:Putative sensor domain-containing protein n=1 Tax=Thraustotheca clavata TaxID=74557 RepID=A0A1W0A7H2_9STRA|nr:hypothetical protein THRCLA_20433 [Thraustotheca clavata]
MYGSYSTTPALIATNEPRREGNSGVLGNAKESWGMYILTVPCKCITIKAIAYHVVNVVFSFLAFVLVCGGLLLGVALVPMCCFGMVLLRAMCYVVHFLATMDVYLHNWILPAEEHIHLSFNFSQRREHIEGHRISPTISQFSRQAMLAMFYFAILKLPLGIVASVSSLAIFIVSVVFLAAAFVPHGSCFVTINHKCVDQHLIGPLQYFGRNGPGQDDDKISILIAGVIMLYVASLLLHLTARLTTNATRYFCCEYFATYNNVNLSVHPTYRAL